MVAFIDNLSWDGFPERLRGRQVIHWNGSFVGKDYQHAIQFLPLDQFAIDDSLWNLFSCVYPSIKKSNMVSLKYLTYGSISLAAQCSFLLKNGRALFVKAIFAERHPFTGIDSVFLITHEFYLRNQEVAGIGKIDRLEDQIGHVVEVWEFDKKEDYQILNVQHFCTAACQMIRKGNSGIMEREMREGDYWEHGSDSYYFVNPFKL